jgi:hypothetical protein
MQNDGPIYRRYAVTVKRNGNKHCPLSEVDKTLKHIGECLKNKGYICLVGPIFERDSRRVLHAHLTVRTEKSFLYTKLRLKNWHIFFEELLTDNDLNKWNNYLKKENLSIPQIQQQDAQEYYNTYNGFI